MAAMASRDPRLVLARRVITRPDDAGGEIFEGVTPQEFEARSRAGQFTLSWSAHGLQYAIQTSVMAALQNGQDVLANLSRAALVQAKDHFSRFDVIRLSADRDILAARLAARGRETPEQIADRLDRACARLPDGITAYEIDNSGTLESSVQDALDHLYPVRA